MTLEQKKDIMKHLKYIVDGLQCDAEDMGDIRFDITVDADKAHIRVTSKDLDTLFMTSSWYDADNDEEWAEVCDRDGWLDDYREYDFHEEED